MDDVTRKLFAESTFHALRLADLLKTATDRMSPPPQMAEDEFARGFKIGDAADIEPDVAPGRGAFLDDLETLLNFHCVDGDSSTPDFILARYIDDCLKAWTRATNEREEWFGREPGTGLKRSPQKAETIRPMDPPFAFKSTAAKDRDGRNPRY